MVETSLEKLYLTPLISMNEIVEFSATVLVPDTNVGGYENTAIDLVANLLGACLAIPFFKNPENTEVI